MKIHKTTATLIAIGACTLGILAEQDRVSEKSEEQKREEAQARADAHKQMQKEIRKEIATSEEYTP